MSRVVMVEPIYVVTLIRDLIGALCDLLDATGAEGSPEEVRTARARAHRVLDAARGGRQP